MEDIANKFLGICADRFIHGQQRKGLLYGNVVSMNHMEDVTRWHDVADKDTAILVCAETANIVDVNDATNEDAEYFIYNLERVVGPFFTDAGTTLVYGFCEVFVTPSVVRVRYRYATEMRRMADHAVGVMMQKPNFINIKRISFKLPGGMFSEDHANKEFVFNITDGTDLCVLVCEHGQIEYGILMDNVVGIA